VGDFREITLFMHKNNKFHVPAKVLDAVNPKHTGQLHDFQNEEQESSIKVIDERQHPLTVKLQCETLNMKTLSKARSSAPTPRIMMKSAKFE